MRWNGARALALPLGELSPQVTERAGSLLDGLSFGWPADPLRPRYARTPLPEGEARGLAGVCCRCALAALGVGLLTLSVLAALGHLSQRERQGGIAAAAAGRFSAVLGAGPLLFPAGSATIHA